MTRSPEGRTSDRTEPLGPVWRSSHQAAAKTFGRLGFPTGTFVKYPDPRAWLNATNPLAFTWKVVAGTPASRNGNGSGVAGPVSSSTNAPWIRTAPGLPAIEEKPEKEGPG